MNPKQHGFRSGRTCLSQLLEHQNKILEKLEKSNNVDVIYIDFAKAFDRVDHGLLLKKLKKNGFNGKIGVWIHNFLSNRQQCVAVNGTNPSEAHVRSDIPKESVLGNYEISNSTVSCFAYDTQILLGIKDEQDT